MYQYVIGGGRYLLYKLISPLALIAKSDLTKKTKVCHFAKIVNSSIGEYSYVGNHSTIINATIGKFCSISENCRIGLASHTMKFLSTSPIFTEKCNGTGISWLSEDAVKIKAPKITVGNDVWIGYNAIIKSGVTIGDGAVIGAGAIVTKDVPPYAIVAGVPAKIIKYRFTEDDIFKLSKLQWWNLSDQELQNNLSLFAKEEISDALDALNKA